MMSEAEREVLREAAMQAGYPRSAADRFCEQVEGRLRQGAEEYGELAYLGRSFSECELEAIEEQHDAGGWSSLALRLLDRDTENGFPPNVAELVRLQVLQGIAEAHKAAQSFTAAIQLYQEHEDAITPAENSAPPFSCLDERLELS